MSKIHTWRYSSRTTVDDDWDARGIYYLELQADDDEEAVRKFWDDRTTHPEFIVAPNRHDSRTNTVVAANVKRILGDEYPIAVMVHGKQRRERIDMIYWLIENNYLPMFPRFMYNEDSPSVPLTRRQLIHEARPILDREREWIFVLHGFQSQHEQAARDYIESTQNNWEVLFE